MSTTRSDRLALTESVDGGTRHIDIPTEAAETLLPAYHDVVAEGYEERLAVFIENHTSFETTITVDGKPIDEWLSSRHGRGTDSA